MKHRNYAVLTGDVINSRELPAPDLESLMRALAGLWKDFGTVHEGAVLGELELFRGDGWQVALARPALCMKAAVFLRAASKVQMEGRFDSRIGIWLGPVERLHKDRLLESNGIAFHLAGSALDNLSPKGASWAIHAHDVKAMDTFGVAFPMMDLLIRRWSKQESAAVVGTLLGWTQEAIAQHPMVAKKDGAQPTQQAVADSLHRIGWKSHWEPCLTKAHSLLEKLAQ